MSVRSRDATENTTVRTGKEENVELLGWAIAAFVVAVIAGLLGFTGIARGAATIAKILFGLFLVVGLVIVLLIVLGISLI